MKNRVLPCHAAIYKTLSNAILLLCYLIFFPPTFFSLHSPKRRKKNFAVMRSPTINHLHYTLSQIANHYGYRPESSILNSSALPDNTSEELKMLDLLSLLLVTRGPRDVGAMSFHSIKDSPVKLYYAKNRPCTPDETTYVTQLFEISTNSKISSMIKYETLFALVLSKCKYKIISRIRKISSTLRRLENAHRWAIQEWNGPQGDSSDGYTAETDGFIRDIVGPESFPPGSHLPAFLKKWFEQLLHSFGPGHYFDYRGFDRSVFNAINVSYYLACDFQAIRLLDPELHRPISKLAEYRAAVRLLVQVVPQLQVGKVEGLIIKEVSLQFYIILPLLY